MSTKKENIRSPLSDELFKTPPKQTKDNEDTATFSTFKGDAKKESTIEQPESSVVESPPAEKGNIKRKESFLKRLFSRKRSSSSVLQSPPPSAQKKRHTKESSDSMPLLKEKATLQEKIEFHQTALSVEVFDDDGKCLPVISEEGQHPNIKVIDSSPQTTTVEINFTADSLVNHQLEVEDHHQAAVKSVAESVAENVVNQAILVIENDINKSEDDKSLPQNKASPKALKVKKKKKKQKKSTDRPVERAVITHNKTSTYSPPFVETVNVEFKKDEGTSKASSSDYDTSSESNESNTSDNELESKPMDIAGFENFGEVVDNTQKQREVEFNHGDHEKQSVDESPSDAHLSSNLRTPDNPLMTFNQPTAANGIPSTVVRAIHKDLQVLSESIDKDLDKLLDENQDQEDEKDEDVSSSASNIAMEKLEEARVISHMPLAQSTSEAVAVHVQSESIDDAAATSMETKNIVKHLSSNTHATNTSSSTSFVKRLSSTYDENVVERQVAQVPSSFDGKGLKKSSSIQERMKLFGEKIPDKNTTATPKIVVEKSQQKKNAKLPEMNKVEESDVVTPLKNISNASLRRSSLTNVDKLKLDGLKGEGQEPSSLEAKKQKWRRSPLELSNKPGSPVAGRWFMDPGSPLSPRLKKHDPESLELYMNSANLDHLVKLHEKTLDDAKLLAIQRAEALLADPTLNEQSTPEAFRGILFQGNKKFVWCVKDTWYSWLELMDELPVELDSEDCYILLHVSQ